MKIKAMQNSVTSLYKDKKNHGFGMKSMKAFVEKYQGQINVDIDSNEFVLTILIPLNK